MWVSEARDSETEGRYDVLRKIIDHVTKGTTEPLLVSSTTLSLIVRQFLGVSRRPQKGTLKWMARQWRVIWIPLTAEPSFLPIPIRSAWFDQSERFFFRSCRGRDILMWIGSSKHRGRFNWDNFKRICTEFPTRDHKPAGVSWSKIRFWDSYRICRLNKFLKQISCLNADNSNFIKGATVKKIPISEETFFFLLLASSLRAPSCRRWRRDVRRGRVMASLVLGK